MRNMLALMVILVLMVVSMEGIQEKGVLRILYLVKLLSRLMLTSYLYCLFSKVRKDYTDPDKALS